jgi:hypothetical protein
VKHQVGLPPPPPPGVKNRCRRVPGQSGGWEEKLAIPCHNKVGKKLGKVRKS